MQKEVLWSIFSAWRRKEGSYKVERTKVMRSLLFGISATSRFSLCTSIQKSNYIWLTALAASSLSRHCLLYFPFAICHEMCPLHHPNNTMETLAPHSSCFWCCQHIRETHHHLFIKHITHTHWGEMCRSFLPSLEAANASTVFTVHSVNNLLL